MVVFTCNNCGESLQKPRVEKHFSFSCRGPKNLTCVDCLKDFRGEEYVMHTKCITENQRYGGKDYVEKAKKGEVKQESWMEMIKSILTHESNLTSGCRNLLDTICNYTNVPRKKQKFINFIKSSSGGRVNSKDIEGIWILIEKYKNNLAAIKPAESGNQKENNKRKLIDDYHESKKAKFENVEANDKFDKRLKQGDCTNANEHPQNMGGKSLQTFSLSNEIISTVTKKGTMPRKKLEKKILKKYKAFFGEIDLEKFYTKFNKKLKKIECIEVNDTTITIKQ